MRAASYRVSMHQLQLPVRNAGLYTAIRSFMVEALAWLAQERASGADISFSVAEHRPVQDGRPLFEYRPMVEGFIQQRASQLRELQTADESSWTVASDPACNAWLRAGRADAAADMEQVAFDEILVPFLVSMGDRHPDFELDEDHLLAHYLRLEQALYAEQRRYVAVVPMWGIRLMYGDLEIAPGVTLRSVEPDLFRMEWPEAAQLNWGDASRNGLPTVLLQFERSVSPDDDHNVLDPLPAVTQVVSVIRALAGGSVHAGPLVLERLDFNALAPRPVPAIAARRCGTLPSKIDGSVARNIPIALRRIAADPEGAAARALERWQLAATAPGLSALRMIFDTLVDIYAAEREVGSAALRIAAVVGVSLPERQAIVQAMRDAAAAIAASRLPDEELAATTRTLASALRATVAAALTAQIPITGMQAYADRILIGEEQRTPLGVS